MKIDKSAIKLVDGFKIRNTLDDDFAVLHHHSTLISDSSGRFYIPKGEWWLDYRHKEELPFLIEIEEFKAPPRIKTYNAYRKYIQQNKCLKPPVPDFVVSRKKKDGRNIVIVKGSIVRLYLDPEFVIGGHDLVYPYIPKGEIWIDAAIDPKEIPYILLHEAIERDYMERGKSYDAAHEFATAADKELRRKDGHGFYPFDGDYPWKNMGNKEIIKQYYV